MNVRQGLIRVTAIVFGPVWWRNHLPALVFGLLVKRFITLPGDTLLRHVVSHRVVAEIDGTGNAVVEAGVRNQPTWVIRFLRGRVRREGVTHTARNRFVTESLAFQLIQLQGLDISAMILIKVGEAIVQENRRSHGFRNVKVQAAGSLVSGLINSSLP